MKMRNIWFVIVASAVLTGCGEDKLESMKELPPEQTTTQTSSTYTGTTVDFYYVSTTRGPRMPSNQLDMPEFPEFDRFYSDDDLFGEEFRRLFGDTARNSEGEVTSDTEETMGNRMSESDDFTDTTVEGAFTEVSITRSDMPYDEMTVTAVHAFETPYYDSDLFEQPDVTMPSFSMDTTVTETVTTADETYDTADTFPDDAFSLNSGDFPQFPYDEFNKLFR